MQDLYSRTDPTQEVCRTVDREGDTAPARQHELDHTRSEIDYLPALKGLDHDM